MARGRNRPPRLEPRPVAPAAPAPPLSPEAQLERARVAGPRSGIGPTELRRIVERIVGEDRTVRGALGPLPGLSLVDAWAAVGEIFGATPDSPGISAQRTLASAHRAGRRIGEVAREGGRIAFAVASPATLLPLLLAAAESARTLGADVPNLADAGPLRVDGRTGRSLRWVGGVAMVTDGRSLCATTDAEAAREWMFVLPRPALVVAEPPFSEVAAEVGIEVVAFAGLDRAALGIAAARDPRFRVVPLRTDCPPAAYETVIAAIRAGSAGEV